MLESRSNLHRFQEGQGPDQEATVLLEASQMAASQGNLEEARDLARAAAQAGPDSPEVWLQLASLARDLPQQQAYLSRAAALDPQPVENGLPPPEKQPAPVPEHEPGGTRSRAWPWILGSLAAVAVALLVAVILLVAVLIWGPVDTSLAALLPTTTPTAIPAPTLTSSQIAAQFGPQLQDAVEGADWERALEIVDIVLAVDPDGAETQRWVLITLTRYGQALVEAGQMEEALAQFERAVALPLPAAEASLWLATTQLYLEGRQALTAGEWAGALHAFSLALEQMPEYGDLDARLTETYRRQGQAAMGGGDWSLAVASLNKAHERAPDNVDIAYLLSKAYRDQAQAALEAGEWAAAIEGLTEATDRLPDDADIVDQLALTHRQRGIIREESGNLHGARSDLEAALALRPGDAVARAHLNDVMYRLFPPKRIEISISKQRFYAWAGDTLVYNFPTSTGLPGRDTAAGHFRVQSKIPNAYSSIWRLHMPYWLGIYWVGNVENGIHALPIRLDGSVMWGGLLGQRASYGCVILSTAAARTIYNWAEIGTPVHIHY